MTSKKPTKPSSPGSELFDLEAGLVTTEADVEALRRLRRPPLRDEPLTHLRDLTLPDWLAKSKKRKLFDASWEPFEL